jgi:hypothetical protein
MTGAGTLAIAARVNLHGARYRGFVVTERHLPVRIYYDYPQYLTKHAS